MNKIFTTLALFMMIAVIGSAQKPKLKSGSFEALKDIKTWSVEVEYEGAEIHKHPPYEEFIKERVTEMNEIEDEAGDEWKETWDKKFNRTYVNKFSLLMNKYMKKVGVTVDKKMENAGGHIKIKTYWIYLGYINPMMKQPSKVSSMIHFYNAAGEELCVVDMIESPGNPMMVYQAVAFGFNAEGEYTRMTESYAKCGKDLAGFLAKKVYK